MATPSVSRNNVIAGVFVLASLVLAVAMSVWISGARQALVPKTPYIVRFTLIQGASGLREGSAVLLGGQPVGRVAGVDFFRPVAGSPPEALDVRVLINADVVLYEDALVFMERPLLGNASVINIAGVGDGSGVRPGLLQGGSPLLQPGEVILGSVAPPAFLAQAGYGPEQIRQFQMMIAEASEAAERINRIAGRIEGEVGPALEGIRTSIEDVNAVTADVRERAPQWTERVDSVLVKTEDFAARLDPVADQAQSAVASADQFIGELRDVLAENRESVNRFVEDMERLGIRLNEEAMPRVNETLATVQQGAEEFAQAGRSFNVTLQEQLPQVQRILANLRIAADQIKLTGIEVRRNPWRLLYQPTRKELESEIFYDAARTYAEAVSDLRAASESLESLAAAGQVVPAEEAQRLQEQLQEAFRRYEAAEQELLDELIRKGQ